MHFHVRDSEGQHTLDAGLYREALLALEREEGLLCQISSEGLGRYTPQQQARCVFESGCKLASVAFREIMADGSATARRFYDEARERALHLQHILYTPCEAASLWKMVEEGAVASEGLCLLFVYGSYAKGIRGMPSFEVFLKNCLSHFEASLESAEAPLWFLCSFGKGEQARLLQATRRGGHTRVGFENNLMRADGCLASSNAQQVTALVARMRAQKLKPADYAETRALLSLPDTRTIA